MIKKRIKSLPSITEINIEPKVRAKKSNESTHVVENELSEIKNNGKIDNKKILSDNRFERHKAFGDLDKRNEISEKVKQGLLKWSFYGVDNENGYHYYLKIKK